MIEEFLRYLEYVKRYSSNTVRSYRTALMDFEVFIKMHEVDFHEVTHNHVRQWIAHLSERGKSADSVRTRSYSVAAFYKYQMVQDKVTANPFSLVDLPDGKNHKKLVKFIEKETIHKLLDGDYFEDDWKGIRAKFVIFTLYSTGIRTNELIGLRIVDYNKKECYIKVFGKGDKQRIVPIPRELNDIYDLYMGERKKLKHINCNRVVVTNDGRPAYWKMIYDIVKEYFAKVSPRPDITPHALRHSYATHMLNNGAELLAIKELLGHSDIGSTEKYTRVSIERLKNIHNSSLQR